MSKAEKNSEDLQLLELAARNPSLAGRELLQEIVTRGAAQEEHERRSAHDLRTALRTASLDDPNYRTRAEQADWLGKESPAMRELYERGATIKGDLLLIPAEEHELHAEREIPFITTLAYAQQKLRNSEQAREFHTLAHTISGENADVRTQLAVFKTYYRRISHDEGEHSPRREHKTARADAIARTLAEMRVMAAEMAKLETRESVEIAKQSRLDTAEARGLTEEKNRLNAAVRVINLGEESLRLPAGLSLETKEGLVSRTIPEIDRRLENGVSREVLFSIIDRTARRPDPAAHLRKLADLTGEAKEDETKRPLSREEYLEAQRTLLNLVNQERQVLSDPKLKDAGLATHEELRFEQVASLAQRLRQSLGHDAGGPKAEQVKDSPLYVSLAGRGEGDDAYRLPVSSVRAYEFMAKIAASAQLKLQTWNGQQGREVRQDLSEPEREERSRIASFLKSYIDERLRDPETRALNTSDAFRQARNVILTTSTPEALGRAASAFLRVNERQSEELRRHWANLEEHPHPTVRPLGERERRLLFFGRAPEHHTPEMRELRIHYGLSRAERGERLLALREGRIEQSAVLKTMLAELENRRSVRAVAHFQASVINEKMNNASKLDLYHLNLRLPPHERAYLVEVTETRKQLLAKAPGVEHDQTYRSPEALNAAAEGRAFGKAPKESESFRTYLASMGQIERRLLNEAVSKLRSPEQLTQAEREDVTLTITEARQLLPPATQREIRLRARNQAWESLVPPEVLGRDPSPEALRTSDMIAHIQEQLQERASLAQQARNDFISERLRPVEERLRAAREIPPHQPLHATAEERGQFTQTVLNQLPHGDAQRLAELERFAVQTREEVYRGFETLDAQRRALEWARLQSETREPRDGDLHKAETVLTERLSDIADAKLSTTFSPPRALAIEQQERNERKTDKAESVFAATPSIFVQTEKEWHYDSLRDVLAGTSYATQSEAQNRAEWQRIQSLAESHDR